MNSAAIDSDRMNAIEDEVKRTVTFEKLLEEPSYKISEQFAPADFLKYRIKIEISTPNNIRQVAEKMVNVGDNIIPTVFLYAKNEAEQGKVRDSIKSFYDRVSNGIVVDFSATPFTDLAYQRFVECKSKERYFSAMPNQDSQVKLAKKSAQDIITEWVRKLYATTLRVYVSADNSEQVTGGSNLRKKFKEINASIFSCGLETITQNDKLFAETGFKETVAQMAMGKISVPNNYSYLRNISERLERDGIWKDGEYYINQPSHPVSKMKLAINAIINSSFEESSKVSVTDLWKELTKPPFGLLQNTGSVFLLGFLLREFADSSYYKKDVNNNTVALNYVDLCELIFAVVKALPKAEGQFIVKQTKEHTIFCQKTGEIFKIAKDKRNSIDDIAKYINIYLTNNNFPMWSMKYYIDEAMYDHPMKEALIKLTELFCEFISPEAILGREKSKVAEDIYRIYKDETGIDDVYTDILNCDNMRMGMEMYIVQYKPELGQTASLLKIDSKDYIAMLTEMLAPDSSYLWHIGETNHQIDNLYLDLRLLYVVNRVLTTKQKSFADIRRAISEKLDNIKLTLHILNELMPSISTILEKLIDIKDNHIKNKSETVSILDSHADDFNDFFNNQFDIFLRALGKYVDESVIADEADFLYKNVEAGTLFKNDDQFVIYMRRELDKYRKNKKILKMFDAWKKVTATDSPKEWASKNGIPILCLFADDLSQVQNVFSALNKTTNLPNESDIDKAIAFINSKSLSILSDVKKCESIFIQYFCGEYAYVVESSDGLRDWIRNITNASVYDWFFMRDRLRSEIIRYATSCYESKYKTRVKAKVHNMSAEEAQKFLNELIEKDPLLGINILKG